MNVYAINVDQPYASLIAHGIKPWETRPSPPAKWPGLGKVKRYPGCGVQPGDLLLIVASKRRPEHDSPVGDWCPVCDFGGRWSMQHFADGVHGAPEAIDLPLGAVVAVARLADVVPIVTPSAAPPCDRFIRRGRSLWITNPNATDFDDISDQIPYGDWTPGRWAWRLEDVRRLDEPLREYDAPMVCDQQNGGHCDHWWSGTGCCDCGSEGGTDRRCIVPVRGKQGVWRPDAALVAACGVTT